MLFVNGHGGNIEALTRAEAQLRAESRDVAVWHPRVPDGDSHAGRTETSMMLAIDPTSVRVDRLAAGSTARWRDIGPTVIADGLRAVTDNGILGDPRGADADHGAGLLDELAAQLRATAAERWG